VLVASVVTLLEAVGVVAFAVVELANLDPDRPSVALTSGAFFLLYAAGLGVAARGLYRLQSWARSMIAMAQLIQLALAWSFRGGETGLVSWVLAVPSVVVLMLLFAPPTTEALFGRPEDDGDSLEQGRERRGSDGDTGRPPG
jgi:hypothetical protein